MKTVFFEGTSASNGALNFLEIILKSCKFFRKIMCLFLNSTGLRLCSQRKEKFRKEEKHNALGDVSETATGRSISNHTIDKLRMLGFQ